MDIQNLENILKSNSLQVKKTNAYLMPIRPDARQRQGRRKRGSVFNKILTSSTALMLKPCHCLQKRRKQSQPHAIKGQRCNFVSLTFFTASMMSFGSPRQQAKCSSVFCPGCAMNLRGEHKEVNNDVARKACLRVYTYVYICMYV